MSQPWKKKDYFSRRNKSHQKFDFWFLVEITMMTVKTLCGEEAVYACFQ